MTKNQTNNRLDLADTKFKKLSIQVSLSGLSFCVADNVTQTILISDKVSFNQSQTPIVLQEALENLLNTHQLTKTEFEEVIVIHKNKLFSLVPNSLFNPDKLSSFLNLNAKLLSNDVLAFDELKHQEVVNVYVPYMNINNYIYELYGAFTYVHNGTVLLESLLNKQNQDTEKICYVYVSENQMDITVLDQRKLLLFNSFEFETKEDFVYYLLFVMEQLELDTTKIKVKVFGDIKEGDEIYNLCFTYIQHLSIYDTNASPKKLNDLPSQLDFTLIHSL